MLPETWYANFWYANFIEYHSMMTSIFLLVHPIEFINTILTSLHLLIYAVVSLKRKYTKFLNKLLVLLCNVCIIWSVHCFRPKCRPNWEFGIGDHLHPEPDERHVQAWPRGELPAVFHGEFCGDSALCSPLYQCHHLMCVHYRSRCRKFVA